MNGLAAFFAAGVEAMGLQPAGVSMLTRTLTVLFFSSALAALATGLVMLLLGWIDWLQAGRWHALSLLQLGYDTGVLEARWFLSASWRWPIHDALAEIPVAFVLLALAPMCWWIGRRLASR